MKTSISNFLLLVAIVFSNTVLAQISKKTIKESTIGNATYVIKQWGDNKSNIENKNGNWDKVKKMETKICDGNPILNEQTISNELNSIVRNIFSADRIKQLSNDNKNSFVIMCYCKRSGEISAINFTGVNTSTISMEEIKALEDAVLKIKFKWDSSVCPDVNYINYNLPIGFKKYL